PARPPRAPRAPAGAAALPRPRSWLCLVSTGLAAGFMDEADAFDAHAAVDRFAHVVDGEGGHRDRGQRLHLDAGAALELAGGADIDGVTRRIAVEFDPDRAEREGVAQRDEIRRALRAHDAGKPRHRQDVALG